MAMQNCPACLSSQLRLRKQRTQCLACGSLIYPDRRSFQYDDHYPAERSHHLSRVQRLKQRSLESWLKSGKIDLKGLKVIEVGFGGGACLSWMATQGAEVHGQEVVRANRESAVRAGLPSPRIVASLDELAPQNGTFDLAVFADSFEHLLDPDQEMEKINRLIKPGGFALLVTPRSDSLSRHMMGKLWPHDLPDHWIIYSLAGLRALWERHSWKLNGTFFPKKYINTEMVIDHLRMKAPKLPAVALPNLDFPLNFGEAGVIFVKDGLSDG